MTAAINVFNQSVARVVPYVPAAVTRWVPAQTAAQGVVIATALAAIALLGVVLRAVYQAVWGSSKPATTTDSTSSTRTPNPKYGYRNTGTFMTPATATTVTPTIPTATTPAVTVTSSTTTTVATKVLSESAASAVTTPIATPNIPPQPATSTSTVQATTTPAVATSMVTPNIPPKPTTSASTVQATAAPSAPTAASSSVTTSIVSATTTTNVVPPSVSTPAAVTSPSNLLAAKPVENYPELYCFSPVIWGKTVKVYAAYGDILNKHYHIKLHSAGGKKRTMVIWNEPGRKQNIQNIEVKNLTSSLKSALANVPAEAVLLDVPAEGWPFNNTIDQLMRTIKSLCEATQFKHLKKIYIVLPEEGCARAAQQLQMMKL